MATTANERKSQRGENLIVFAFSIAQTSEHMEIKQKYKTTAHSKNDAEEDAKEEEEEKSTRKEMK